jgi:hypothetical protein
MVLSSLFGGGGEDCNPATSLLWCAPAGCYQYPTAFIYRKVIKFITFRNIPCSKKITAVYFIPFSLLALHNQIHFIVTLEVLWHDIFCLVV